METEVGLKTEKCVTISIYRLRTVVPPRLIQKKYFFLSSNIFSSLRCSHVGSPFTNEGQEQVDSQYSRHLGYTCPVLFMM